MPKKITKKNKNSYKIGTKIVFDKEFFKNLESNTPASDQFDFIKPVEREVIQGVIFNDKGEVTKQSTCNGSCRLKRGHR